MGIGDGVESGVPVRRCISCRGNGAKSGFLRFGVLGGVVCFDVRRKLAGRGCYVCASRKCLEKAFSGGFKKAFAGCDFSGIGVGAADFVSGTALPGLRVRAGELVVSGYRSGVLLTGAEAVESAAKGDALAAYMLAVDASGSTRRKYGTNADRKGLPCLGILSSAEYGRLLGGSDRTVLGWRPGGIYDAYREVESAIIRLSEEFPD